MTWNNQTASKKALSLTNKHDFDSKPFSNFLFC